MFNTREYLPGKYPVTGSVSACNICGVPKKNQHPPRESAQCDWQRRSPAERARIEAARKVAA
jgi:hypothetical protein